MSVVFFFRFATLIRNFGRPFHILFSRGSLVHRLDFFSLSRSQISFVCECVFFAHRNFKLTLYDVHLIHACCYYCCCSLLLLVLSTRRLFSLLTFHNSSNVNKERRVKEEEKNYRSIFTILNWFFCWVIFFVAPVSDWNISTGSQ